MTRSICEDFEDLLAEIREECPRAALSPTVEFAEIPLDELATWLTKREHAAAERMRTEASGLVRHVLAQRHPSNRPLPAWMVRSLAEAIDELEPEETNE